MASLSASELLKRPGRIEVFINKIRTGSPFELVSGGTVTFPQNTPETKRLIQELEKAAATGNAGILSSYTFPHAKYGILKLTSFKKSAEFGGGGGGAGGNRGDIAEGIFGAAVAARFVNKDRKINVSDVQSLLKKLSPSNTIAEIELPAPNKNFNKDDTVRFYLSLAKSNMTALLDQRLWGRLNDLFNSAVKYANSSTVEAWAKLLHENRMHDYIEVLADGLGDQTGTKVDVRVVIRHGGKDMKPTPTNINVSLKAGDVKQFGQVGGAGFDKQVQLWDSLFKIDVSGLEKQYTSLISEGKVEKALYLTYEHAASTFNRMFRGSDKKRAVKFLGEGIEFHATRSETDVTLVQLNKNEAKIYNFNDVAGKISALSLEATIVDTSGKPKMVIKDRSGGILLEVRVKAETQKNGFYIRNYIEKGSLLGELIASYA